MTSTAASAPPPSSSATQASRTNASNASGTARTGQEAGAENGLFAHLLSLLGDALQPAPAEEGEAPLLATPEEEAPDTNPLAALAGWPGSPVAAEAAGSGEASDGAAALRPGQVGKERAAGAEQPGLAVDNGAPPADRIDHETPSNPITQPQRGQIALKGIATTTQLQQAIQIQKAPGNSAAAAAAASATGANSALGLQSGDGMVWRRAANGAGEAGQSGNAQLGAVRSTVTLNERFGPLSGMDASNPALRDTAAASANASPGATTGPANGGGSGSGTGTAATLAAGEGAGADLSGGEPGSDHGAAEQDGGGDGMAQASGEAEDAAISHWGTQNLRHASLRVGQPGEDAIDIQLSVKGQEAQVEFRTDSAEARATLENSADASLSELLERSGLQLTGLSVGAQGQPSGRQGNEGRGGVERAGRASDVNGAQGHEPSQATAPRAVPVRADGSRPLDLFV